MHLRKLILQLLVLTFSLRATLAAPGEVMLFNSKDLSGWTQRTGKANTTFKTAASSAKPLPGQKPTASFALTRITRTSFWIWISNAIPFSIQVSSSEATFSTMTPPSSGRRSRSTSRRATCMDIRWRLMRMPRRKGGGRRGFTTSVAAFGCILASWVAMALSSRSKAHESSKPMTGTISASKPSALRSKHSSTIRLARASPIA